MAAHETIGFIGLGVMGGPMCRNVAQKHLGSVIAFDLNASALADLADTKAVPAGSVLELAGQADVILLSLPGDAQVERVCLGPDGIIATARPGSVVVDLSTTSVAAARRVGEALAARGISFADAPVARTREAARKGELSIMVGAGAETFARIQPLLAYMGTDVTHCGAIGTGQTVKLINNNLLFEHVVALAEMMVLGERAGVAPQTLLEAVSKGSGDSFALRNHGMKAMLPRAFPEKAFPPEYVLKDIDYLLALAKEHGLDAKGVELARHYYDAARTHGMSGRYFPGVIAVVEAGGMHDLKVAS
ncbi:2-hydroxy-3-oxopropionate reductase [Azorhizobium oxalatiphilum]|uniref:2-hydroxy-3-oxopropionate reductase n=1 Tax=Azorhizobium oxalatiphilum TaxID=980631 RepID=A0A917F5Z9_9HYPH|nr:NAD(P)-dependent oxidoreductase [Azorhizobium oxalatiphilum]GGF51426.1 2-hydroxy-3-oxopropionate reductase [Azorhizobium oxalatiphilum]